MVNLWPQGYREDFNSGNGVEPLLKALDELPHGGKCLEIGCGDGYWTSKLLVPIFKEVVCVDIIDKPTYFKGEYHKQKDCLLSQFGDKSFDVVYSYGTFCHLSIECQKSYLKEIKRVMRGKGLIMFANWPRHHSLKFFNIDFIDDWYYNDIDITTEMLKDFKFIDFDPTYRDTIALIW